jgi:AcrR family transcriptional regulator
MVRSGMGLLKGAETRQRITDRAFLLAGRDGLAGLTIGRLAEDMGMSKSGLFAHFGSKEDLQIAVLQTASDRFTDQVIIPAFKAPRGLPRLRKLFELWLEWITDPGMPGGCIFVAASTELDDQPGRPRDFLVAAEKELLGFLTKAVQLAVEQGHFRSDTDCEQLAFELHAMVLGFTHAKRLLREPKVEARARTAFDRLVASVQRR